MRLLRSRHRSRHQEAAREAALHFRFLERDKCLHMQCLCLDHQEAALHSRSIETAKCLGEINPCLFKMAGAPLLPVLPEALLPATVVPLPPTWDQAPETDTTQLCLLSKALAAALPLAKALAAALQVSLAGVSRPTGALNSQPLEDRIRAVVRFPSSRSSRIRRQFRNTRTLVPMDSTNRGASCAERQVSFKLALANLMLSTYEA